MKRSNTTAGLPAPCAESFLTPRAQVNYVEPESAFSTLRKTDFYHGPTFQNLIGSQVAANRSITKFAISPAALKSDNDYVLHPTTIDSIFQPFYVYLPSEAKEGTILVPRSIGTMSVPRRLGRHTGHKLLAFVNPLQWSRRDAAFN
jgi:hypothetical protein